MFIRLSYEYESLDLGKNIVLYNELSSKTYTIDVQNTDMMRDVIEGSTEEKLSEKYGERWDIFFDILKRNCAVVISKHPTHFFDTWDYGAKGISAKDKNAMPKIQFLTLQLTDMCDLQCKSCGGTYEFPCHVCEGQNRTSACELNLDSLFVFINSLYMYGLNEVTIEGGDPFTNQDRLMNVNYSITTNGLLLSNKEISDFLKENEFWIVVSIDGTKSNHDRYRVTRGGTPTYDCLMEIIKENFSLYKSIYSICCYDVTSDLSALTKFYEENDRRKGGGFPAVLRASRINSAFTDFYNNISREQLAAHRKQMDMLQKYF